MVPHASASRTTVSVISYNRTLATSAFAEWLYRARLQKIVNKLAPPILQTLRRVEGAVALTLVTKMQKA